MARITTVDDIATLLLYADVDEERPLATGIPDIVPPQYA